MWLDLFPLGGFWFWILIALETICILRCLYDEDGWSLGVSFVVLGFILWLLGDFNVFAWIWFNPILVLKCVAAHLVIGIIWSLVQWKMFSINVRDQLNDAKDEFMSTRNIKMIPKSLRKDWQKHLRDMGWNHLICPSYIRSMDDIIPDPKEHKSRILYWIGYWPLNAPWFFFFHLIERRVKIIYKIFNKPYQSIAKETFVNVPRDFDEND